MKRRALISPGLIDHRFDVPALITILPFGETIERLYLENVTKGRIIRNDRLKIYFPRTTRERFEIEEEDLVFIPRKNGLWVMILNS